MGNNNVTGSGGNGSDNKRESDDNTKNESEDYFIQSPCSPGSPLMYSPHMFMGPPSATHRTEHSGYSSAAMASTSSSQEQDLTDVGGFPAQPRLVPTMIIWSLPGNDVAVEGSFDNWTGRQKLQKSGNHFTVVKLLPPGVYQYKFIVDGEWKYDPNQPAMYDESGNVNNVMEVQEYVPENLGGLSGFDPPPSPPESYDCEMFTEEDLKKEPPLIPPHLKYTLLNVPPAMDAQQALPRPWHVILNHMYVQRGTQNVQAMVIGTTYRYNSKYITSVIYKPKILPKHSTNK